MNKRNRQNMRGEFRQLQRKLFIRTAILLLIAVVLTFALYSFVLAGHFANGVVSFLVLFTGDYDRALNIYQHAIREHLYLVVLILVLIVFLIILRIYLTQFAKYFNEINQGIDALIDENAGEVRLSSELAATEKKINSIKHTLEQRKLATENAENRKNDLIVYLAHDLKTPLTSVIGYLTLLQDETQISEELREKYTSISLEKAERLEELINEFFEITRFNISDITLEYQMVNITRMLEQITFEFQPMFQEKNLQYVLDIPVNTMVRCDVNKMQRVFDNLLKNAVNYSFVGGMIQIIGRLEKNWLQIRFVNDGYTIPPEKLERIFEQFYRLDTARSSGSGGAGLGLAIAKEIVERHGGTITAKSENEKTEFVVRIPLS